MRTRLTPLVAIVVCGCGTPTGRGDPVSVVDNLCGHAGVVEPFSVTKFANPTLTLQHGGITSTPGGWVVAGIETDASSVSPTLPPDEARVPRIFHEFLGAVPVPARETGRPPMEAPVPVVMPKGNWGLLWVEATRPDWHRGQWLSHWFTQLWFAERAGGVWRPAQLILESDLGIEWIGQRTIRPTADGAALVMVTIEERAERHVMYGSVHEPLRRLPLAGQLQPAAATFLVEQNGELLAVVAAAAVKDGGGPITDLALLSFRSSDHGVSWSPPEEFMRVRGAVRKLGLHRDHFGVLQLVWTEGFTRARHFLQDSLTSQWIETAIEQTGSMSTPLDGISGVDRCGRLTFIRGAITRDGELELRLARLEARNWIVTEGLRGFVGVNLLDGIGHDGTWYVGWSGYQRTADAEATRRMELWLVTP